MRFVALIGRNTGQEVNTERARCIALVGHRRCNSLPNCNGNNSSDNGDQYRGASLTSKRKKKRVHWLVYVLFTKRKKHVHWLIDVLLNY